MNLIILRNPFDHFKYIKSHKESIGINDEIIRLLIEEAKETCKLHKITRELDVAIVNYVLFRLTAGVGDINLGGSIGVTKSYNYGSNSFGKKFMEILKANRNVNNFVV